MSFFRYPTGPERLIARRRLFVNFGGMRAMLCVIGFSLALAGARADGNQAAPLPRAHAHNDYEHERPLLDALEHGFCSVEADVHLRDGELLIGHDPEDLEPGNTLRKLYLEPLKTRVWENRGRVYPGGPSVILLIDFKTAAEPTYAALKEVLRGYEVMLTRFEPGQIVTNAVTVIISGNRPRERMLSEERRLAGYDGRLADLGKGLPPSFAPLISDNWRAHFQWDGSGPFPPEERRKLEEIVQQTHGEGKLLRFWAVPDAEPAWAVLREAGVDLINTDRLAELAAFLRSNR